MEYLKRFVLSLLAGVGFALGVTVIAFGASKYYEAQRRGTADFQELSPDQVSFSDIHPIEFTRHLAISGIITNNSKSSVAVDVETQLIREGKVVYTCTDYIHQVPGPGKSGPFQVECKEVERASALPGITFQVKPRRVRVVN